MSMIPQNALNQHIAILGKTGSGKSYAAKGIVEDLLYGGRQVCVLDPTGAWWGLRLGADGKKAGFNIVLIGGKHADIPLSDRSGHAVARLVTEQRANVVIDTTGLTVGEYTRWFTDFASTLYTTIRNPLHLVIDEAHYFAPQGKAPDPAAGKMIHACNRLMSGGRSLGIRGLLITQRPAKLHKDSLTCADTLIAMRLIAPQDRGAVKDWIDGAGDAAQGKAVLDSLAQLQRGEGWVWYPEGTHLERVKFPKIKTYDSSATPTHGSDKRAPVVAEIKLDEVRKAMADAVKEAEANDPALLRKRIAELERQVAAKPTAAIDQGAIDRAVAGAVAARDRDWKAALKQRETIISDLAGRMSKIEQLAHVNGEATPAIQVNQVVTKHKVPEFRESVNNHPRDNPSSPVVRKPQSAVNGALRKILIALAQHQEGLSYSKIGVFSGVSTKGGSFSTYLSRARSAGWITGNDKEGVTITSTGLDALGDYDPLPTGEDLANYWLREFGDGAQSQILRVLIEAYPQALSHKEIHERSGVSIKGGSYSTYLSRLRSRDLITGSKEIKASAQLF